MAKSILRIIWNEVKEPLKIGIAIVSYFATSILIGWLIILPSGVDRNSDDYGFAIWAGVLIGMVVSAYIYGFIFHMNDAIKHAKEQDISLEEAWEETKTSYDCEP